ncbi:MAG: hypothetical protein R3E95_10690 [Thiolinea sp.]
MFKALVKSAGCSGCYGKSSDVSLKFQSALNWSSGSAVARTDVLNDDFDACGKKGMEDLEQLVQK